MVYIIACKTKLIKKIVARFAKLLMWKWLIANTPRLPIIRQRLVAVAIVAPALSGNNIMHFAKIFGNVKPSPTPKNATLKIILVKLNGIVNDKPNCNNTAAPIKIKPNIINLSIDVFLIKALLLIVPVKYPQLIIKAE